MLGTILIVILILMLLGAMPSWNHSRSWGYGPSGGLGTVLLIVVILMVMGRISMTVRFSFMFRLLFLASPCGAADFLEHGNNAISSIPNSNPPCSRATTAARDVH